MYGNKENFKYSIRGTNRVIETGGNYTIRLTQIAWAGKNEPVNPDDIHLDIRRFSVDRNGETPRKGVSFLTKEAPDNLIKALIEEGYGSTYDIISYLKERDDFQLYLPKYESAKEEPTAETVDAKEPIVEDPKVEEEPVEEETVDLSAMDDFELSFTTSVDDLKALIKRLKADGNIKVTISSVK